MMASGLPPHGIARVSGAFIAYLATTVFLYHSGYVEMFTRFAPWDDEGSLLITLRPYVRGLALYEEIFTQYGPAYYQIFGALFSLPGMVVDHDHGRMVALAFWSITALTCALTITALTRSVLLGLLTQLLMFRLFLTKIGDEPMAPGVLTSLLLALILATLAIPPRHKRPAALALGVLTALLTFTKVNVGGFVVLAVMLVAVTSIDWVRKRPILASSGVVFLAVVPGILMNTALVETWVQRYAILVTLAIILLGLALLRKTILISQRFFLYATVSAVGATSLVVGGAIWRGTSLLGVIRGVVLDPISQPGVLTIPLYLPPHDGKLALFATSLFAALTVWEKWGPRGASGDLLGGLVRLGVGALLLYTTSAIGPLWHFYFYLVPLAWLAALSPPGLEGPGALAIGRRFLASVAVFQTLHAYPVAGNQVMFGAFLLIPVGSVCVHDGLRQLARFAEGIGASRWRYAFAPSLLFLAICVSAAVIHQGLALERHIYATGRAPELGGATRLRLAREEAQPLEWVTGVIRERCSTFVTYPGLNSFYFFTNMDAPTSANVGTWMYLLDETEQQKIVNRLSRDDRACLVRNVPLIQVWARGRVVPRGPLLRYLEEEFTPYGRHGDYEVLMKRNRRMTRSSGPTPEAQLSLSGS